MTFYLWVYMLRGPKFWPTDPKFCGEFESEVRSGFWARNREIKDSGVLGSEGDNSPFRSARPKLTSYSDFPYPKPRSTRFLVPTLFWMEWVPGRIYPEIKVRWLNVKNYFRGGEFILFWLVTWIDTKHTIIDVYPLKGAKQDIFVYLTLCSLINID